ncbi:Unknown protein sequence [Pseudomonas amygdali pv. lachrymans]|uniref:Uncharacterized protein n=1 Tax=Pseudomonas amygdali pv. lachrymans TaxID=53707 RepID=A0ABR5KTE6_PSEAV|nr:Unknown protein sequence [Pseudomonas amygdali pv. lachrymans]
MVSCSQDVRLDLSECKYLLYHPTPCVFTQLDALEDFAKGNNPLKQQGWNGIFVMKLFKILVVHTKKSSRLNTNI